MKKLMRLVAFEFALVRMLFFRMIFERLTNTLMAAVAGFSFVYVAAFVRNGIYVPTTSPDHLSAVQGMIFYSFLYGETIMANWQYTTNRTGRMELIFNSTQAPLKIITVKAMVSACVTLASMILIYLVPLAWFGLLGALSGSFWLVALATFMVCTAVMTFNAFFEFQIKQVKALTSMLNLVLPFMAMRYAQNLPKAFDLLPYFNSARFLGLNQHYGVVDVAWLFLSAAVTSLFFLFLAQLLVRRIRNTASVYVE